MVLKMELLVHRVPLGKENEVFMRGGVWVPAFCVWEQGIASNQSSSVPMVTSDYLPTILDMISINHILARPMDGISLKEIIEGNQKERGASIGFLFRNKISWVNYRYKLISTDDGNTYELYDLIQDSEEKKDLFVEQKEIALKMQVELSAWRNSVNFSRNGGDY